MIDVSWRKIYQTTRKNAFDRSIPFFLTLDDIQELVERADGRCMVSGIPFEYERPERGYRRPFAPSIDRVNSDRGYERRNVRLVCVLVNLAMNDWGVRPLMRVARHLVAREEAARPEEIETMVLRSTEYFTSKEYLELVDADPTVLRTLSGRITVLVRKYCEARGITYLAVNVPIRQRKDGVWIFGTQWAFPRSAFEACVRIDNPDILPDSFLPLDDG